MKYLALICCFSLAALPVSSACGEEALTLGQLNQPLRLTGADLQQLMTEASMSRTTSNGSIQRWSNDTDGSFVMSNSRLGAKPSTMRGTWHISDDRYCVIIEKKGGAEDWCRLVIKTTHGYYLAKSDKFPTEKVNEIGIKAK